MKFNIRKNADLPELILEIQNKDIMYNMRERLLNSKISIDVFREDGCKQVISCGQVSLYEKNDCEDSNAFCGRLFMVYKFNKRFTSKEGIYKAKIKITFNDNGDTLILPTNEDIDIVVIS